MNNIYKLSKRIWEIDFFRGIAFFLMVLFHIFYDLEYIFNTNFAIFDNEIYKISISLTGKIAAFLFMFLCGVSAILSKNCLKNGIKIFSAGLLLTLATYIADYFFHLGVFISFGILHLLGISLIICHLLKKLPNYAIFIISALIIAMGFITENYYVNVNYLFPLGFITPNYVSADFYPIIPYSAFVFAGLAAGKMLYKTRESLIKPSRENKNGSKDNFICFSGRHSLFLYLIHQIIIIPVIYLILLLTGQTSL